MENCFYKHLDEIKKAFDRKEVRIKDNKKVTFQKGLSIDEISQIEKFYNLSFNIDHRNYLMRYVLIGGSFYDWRNDTKNNVEHIKKMLNWPLEGILFDIEHNIYWPREIEIKPERITQKKDIFIKYYQENISKLVPIYGHRYMCSEPKKTGAPVYSVYQTDIIYYGDNILDYFSKEFGINIKNNYEKWEEDNTIYWPQFCFYE